jgi:hypothetical protein
MSAKACWSVIPVKFKESVMTEGNSRPENGTKDFLLAEYELLKDLRANLQTQTENRMNFFMLIVSGTIAVLAGIAQSNGGIEHAVLHNASLVVIFSLLLFGLQTFLRFIEVNISSTTYTRGLNRIRRYFLDRDQSIANHLILPTIDDVPKFGEIGFRSSKLSVIGVIGFTGTIIVINSLLAGTFLGMLMLESWNFLGTFVVVTLLVFFLQCCYYARRMKKAAKVENVTPKFPSSKKEEPDSTSVSNLKESAKGRGEI